MPYPIYAGVFTALAFGGFLISGYLSISHYRVYTDVGYRSFCAISRSINCDTVSQSAYSIFLGLPVPLWGVAGYGFLLLLTLPAFSKAANRRRIWPTLLLFAGCYSGYSIILAVISSYYISSYCIMCIATYAINFLLLFYAWLIRRRFPDKGFLRGLWQDYLFLWDFRKRVILVFAPLSIGFAAFWMWLPTYWQMEPMPPSTNIPMGMTEDGHPWIGSEEPLLTITEFADYQCFQCGKMHFFLRQIILKNPGKVRLIHRHYPMDNEVNPIVQEALHIGSGKLAMLAIYAATQNKFWKMNDVLFDNARKMETLDTSWLAKKVGLDPHELAASLQHPYIKRKLAEDIWYGMKKRITGTPTYEINGKLYSGYIPPEIFREYISK